MEYITGQDPGNARQRYTNLLTIDLTTGLATVVGECASCSASSVGVASDSGDVLEEDMPTSE